MEDDLIKELIDIVRGSKEFVISQAPDVVKQLITFKIVETSVECMGLLIFIGILLLIFNKLYHLKPKDKYDFDADFFKAVGCILITVIFSVCFCAFFHNLTHLLQVYFAPKGFILDYLIQSHK